VASTWHAPLGVGRITADSQLSQCRLPGSTRRFAPGSLSARRGNNVFVPRPATSLRRRIDGPALPRMAWFRSGLGVSAAVTHAAGRATLRQLRGNAAEI
jgi:hypothetical protein